VRVLLSVQFQQRSTSTVPVLTFYKSLVISIQPSRNIHAEHPQHETSREHVQIVQSGSAYQPGYSVDDGENNNDGSSIASDCTHGQPAFHFPPSVGIPRKKKTPIPKIAFLGAIAPIGPNMPMGIGMSKLPPTEPIISEAAFC
jgi:hypothetical protein